MGRETWRPVSQTVGCDSHKPIPTRHLRPTQTPGVAPSRRPRLTNPPPPEFFNSGGFPLSLPHLLSGPVWTQPIGTPLSRSGVPRTALPFEMLKQSAFASMTIPDCDAPQGVQAVGGRAKGGARSLGPSLPPERPTRLLGIAGTSARTSTADGIGFMLMPPRQWES